MRKLHVTLAIAAGLVGASAASADSTILTFGFTDLAGQFNLGTGLFSALGVDQGVGQPLRSQGDVTRLIAPPGTATYQTGQANGRVDVELAVSGIVGPTANGVGTIDIRDANNDVLHASVNGQFIQNGPAVFFNGTLTNVAFVNVSGDGTFDGPGGGSIPLSFSPAPPPFTGALVQLYIGSAGAFFTQSFQNISTQISGAIVPAPASLGLLGVGLLAAGRRRRA
jgi:hypothetical protein